MEMIKGSTVQEIESLAGLWVDLDYLWVVFDLRSAGLGFQLVCLFVGLTICVSKFMHVKVCTKMRLEMYAYILQ